MFCQKCGNQISDDATLCPYCGAKIEKNTPSEQAPIVVASATKTFAQTVSTTWLFNITSCFLLLLSAVLWLFVGYHPKATNFATDTSIYKMLLESTGLTYITVFIMIAFALAALAVIFPLLYEKASKAGCMKVSALSASYAVLHSLMLLFAIAGNDNFDYLAMNAIGWLFAIFSILAWITVILCYAYRRNQK